MGARRQHTDEQAGNEPEIRMIHKTCTEMPRLGPALHGWSEGELLAAANAAEEVASDFVNYPAIGFPEYRFPI